MYGVRSQTQFIHRRIIMALSDRENESINTLDFYIQYNQLNASDLGRILLSCNSLYDGAYEMYGRETTVRFAEAPALIIDEMYTGNSIKFRFTESWLPTFSSDKDDDIVVGVPKKLGIPLLIGYLLLSSAEKILNVRNEYLEMKKNEIELQLKQHEISKIMENKERLNNLQKKADELFLQINHNQRFMQVTVNETTIKQADDASGERSEQKL